MSLLVLNAGSSSLKYAVFEDDGLTLRVKDTLGLSEGTSVSDMVFQLREALQERKILSNPHDLRAIGQRVVHGGTAFRTSVRIDQSVRQEIERLTEIAPLHNPPALQSMDGAERAFPGTPQIGVFDTAYYADLPPRRFVYPLPYEWFEKWGIRRFGFHGISHASVAERAAEILRRGDLRLVTCHLGNGCSVTASRAGRAEATSMGFTPLEGLMMGTRPGSFDPGILLYIQRRLGLTTAALESILNHESGLKGVSGISPDIRLVENAAASGHARAQLALDLFSDRVREAIGAMTVTLGGLDALVFTGGIGENSSTMRGSISEGLGCLSVSIDPEKNRSAAGGDVISMNVSGVRVIVIHADEERFIAREAARLSA